MRGLVAGIILLMDRSIKLGDVIVRSEILNRVWELFREHSIALPFPQRDLHIKDWPGSPTGREG